MRDSAVGDRRLAVDEQLPLLVYLVAGVVDALDAVGDRALAAGVADGERDGEAPGAGAGVGVDGALQDAGELAARAAGAGEDGQRAAVGTRAVAGVVEERVDEHAAAVLAREPAVAAVGSGLRRERERRRDRVDVHLVGDRVGLETGVAAGAVVDHRDQVPLPLQRRIEEEHHPRVSRRGLHVGAGEQAAVGRAGRAQVQHPQAHRRTVSVLVTCTTSSVRERMGSLLTSGSSTVGANGGAQTPPLQTVPT